MEKQVKLVRLEDSNDLEILIRGDVVQLILNSNSVFNSDKEKLAVYHGKSELYQLQFVCPEEGQKYIVMHMAKGNRIDRRDGKIIMREDRSVTQSFSNNNIEYDELNRTLIMGGFR